MKRNALVPIRNKQASAPSNIEEVMLKQNELMARLVELTEAGNEPDRQTRQDVVNGRAHRRGVRTMGGRKSSIEHPTMPLEYDDNRLARLYGNSHLKSVRARKKHTMGTVGTEADHRPLYELGFFQDCALDAALWSLMVQPMNSIVNRIPVRANNNISQKFGFITAYNVTETAPITEPSTSCDPCIRVDFNMDACKISFPYGRLCRGTKTLETNELIRRACAREYDDFYFVGDLHGYEVDLGRLNLDSQVDRQFITQSALKRQLYNLARHFQLYTMEKVWTGDPANNSGTMYKEWIGLINMIRDDYGEVGNPIPIESMTGGITDCAALNSDIKDFGGRCVNDTETAGPTIFELLQEMEDTLYQRAQGLNALPVQWVIYMISPIWSELVKTLPCQMAVNGCNVPVSSSAVPQIVLNDGNSLFTMQMREQLQRSRTLTLNGRTYPVEIDDTLPYTKTLELGPPPTQKYTSDIFFVPFVANGEEVLYWEHMDYAALGSELQPLPGSATDMLGWTDDGRFHHAITMERWCFEIQSKMEARLIFKAPHLAGRIQDVAGCPLQAKPMAFNGAGLYAPTLGGAPTE